MEDLMTTYSKDMKFMSTEEIKKACPSAYTTKPSQDVSKYYTHIPTYQIIEDMEKLGWGVVDAKEVKARKYVGTQKHMLTFRNTDIVVEGNDGDTVYPQVIVTNSHDGKNSFKFQCGLYRLVCSNGLVVADAEFGKLRITHMGYNFETLQETIKNIVEQLPLTVESMNKFKNTELTKKQKYDLARKALETRFDVQKEQKVDKIYQIDLDEFLKPVRKEDEGDNLWSVFNVIQEKIVEGDFEYISGTRLRKARKIKNFRQDLKVNEKLFSVAKEFAV